MSIFNEASLDEALSKMKSISGEFARHVANARTVADSGNAAILDEAFKGLFKKHGAKLKADMLGPDVLGRHHADELGRAGYRILDSLYDPSEKAFIKVEDPISCSSGSKRWSEYREVILRSSAEVAKFINDRELIVPDDVPVRSRHATALRAAGFRVTMEHYEFDGSLGDSKVVVAEKVKCTSGLKEWTENRNHVLMLERQVEDFIKERLGS